MKYKPDWSPDTIAKVELFLTKDMRVFEWGIGNSTLWLAERCKTVYSMEHSHVWLEKIKDIATEIGIENIQFNLYDLDDRHYYEYIFDVPKPDLIIIDGRNRMECMKTAVDVGSPILLDDSERPRYAMAFDMGLEFEDTTPDERGQKATFFK